MDSLGLPVNKEWCKSCNSTRGTLQAHLGKVEQLWISFLPEELWVQMGTFAFEKLVHAYLQTV